MSSPLCNAPFSRVFSTATSYRNCCATNPQIVSLSSDSVVKWWNSSELDNFRKKLYGNQLPEDCAACSISEEAGGNSFRTALNKIPHVSNQPNSWNLVFGNICNIACWTCSERYSSTIAQQKQQISILPLDFQDPNEIFLRRWPDLHDSIIKSYDHYDVITLTVLGGEPTYNKTVIDFLSELVENGLSQRTRLEITTNGTKLNTRLSKILEKNNWNYTSVFVSVDAIGKKAEWLRYGSHWKDVENSIDFYQQNGHYIELHTVASMLNICDLPEVHDYAESKNIKHTINSLSHPAYFRLQNWDGARDFLNRQEFESRNLIKYYNSLSESPVPGTKQNMASYIQQFTNRKKLADFDVNLAKLLDLL